MMAVGIPAAAVGAPHLRYRVFIVAHAQRDELRQQPVSVFGRGGASIARHDGAPRELADPDGRGLEVCADLAGHSASHSADRCSCGRRCNGRARIIGPRRWRQPTNGGQWAAEPDVGRVAHGVPSRVHRLRCLGNAVVPQVAELIGWRIIAAHLAEEAA